MTSPRARALKDRRKEVAEKSNLERYRELYAQDRDNPKVTAALASVCYPPAGIAPDAVMSIVGTMSNDPGIFRGRYLLKKTGPSIDEARNEVVNFFLGNPNTGLYLVWVDTDQVWEPLGMYEWLERMAENDRQVVSALVPRYVEPEHRIEHPFVILRDTEDGYYETKAMSAGVYALRRDLLERLVQQFGSAFVSAPIGMHEDTMIGTRIKALTGIPLLVDPRFKVGHIKALTLRFPENDEEIK